MKIYVGGVNGVGKTSVLKEVCRQTGLKYVHGTGVFMESLSIAKDYKKLRLMPDSLREEKLEIFFTKFSEEEDDFIMDSHYKIMVNGKIKTVVKDWINLYDGLLFLKAEPSELLKRIIHSERDRSLFAKGDSDHLRSITNFQNISEDVFIDVATKNHIRHLVVDNHDGEFTQTVDTIVNFINDIKSNIGK